MKVMLWPLAISIAEIETDKATMEFEAVDEGVIGQIIVAEGSENVKVNSPIATILAEGEPAEAQPSAAPPATCLLYTSPSPRD